MRTTVSIDDDLLAEAKAEAARQRRTLSELVQDALRIEIASRVRHPGGVEFPVSGDPNTPPLVDLYDKEALAEAMGDNEPPWHAF